MVAASIANLENGGDRITDQSANLHSASISRSNAAEKLNVSERTDEIAESCGTSKADVSGGAQVEPPEESAPTLSDMGLTKKQSSHQPQPTSNESSAMPNQQASLNQINLSASSPAITH